jgi:hypothetical protein
MSTCVTLWVNGRAGNLDGVWAGLQDNDYHETDAVTTGSSIWLEEQSSDMQSTS